MRDDYRQPSITPLRKMQLLTVEQIFQAMTLAQNKNYRGYQIAVKHISQLLRKYMPVKMRDEIDSLYQKEKDRLVEIKKENLMGEKLQDELYLIRQKTADAVFSLSCQALVYSPIVDEMQVTDIDSDLDWDELKKKINTARFKDAIG